MLSKATARQMLNPQILNKMRGLMNNANSPEMQTVMNACQSQGLTPEQMVRSICAQRGINVEDLLNMLK